MAGTSCGRGSARKPLAELLAPAIALRRGGLPGPRGDRRLLAGARSRLLQAWPDSATTYLLDGQRRRSVGEVFKNPQPGRARYRAIADERPRRLLQGRDRQGDRRLQRSQRRLLLAEGLRRAHDRLGRAGLARTIAATTSGSCRRTARASPRCRCSTCSSGYDLQDAGPDIADYCTCSSRPRSWPTPTGPSSTPTRRSASCRSTELISKAYAERAAQADRPGQGARPTCPPAIRSSASGDTIYLTRRRQGPQLLLADPEQLHRLRLAGRAGRPRLRAAEPRHAVRARREAPQPPGAAQAAVPHDHPGDGDEGRQAVVLLRRDGRRHAAAGARAGAGEPDRLRHERAGGRRRRPRGPRRQRDADGQARRRAAAR